MSIYAIKAICDSIAGGPFVDQFGPSVMKRDQSRITLRQFNLLLNTACFCDPQKQEHSLSDMRINTWEELSLCEEIVAKLQTLFQIVWRASDPDKQQFFIFKEMVEQYKKSGVNPTFLNLHSDEPTSDEITEKIHLLGKEIIQTGTVFGVCLLTNEKNIAIPKLRENKGVHIGVSAWHNFDIIAAKRSSRGILIDFNPDVGHLLRATLKFIKDAKDRHSYLKSITPYLTYHESKLRLIIYSTKSKSIEEVVEEELSREGSWLFSDSAYSHIRKLALEGKIAIITGNMINKSLLIKIRTILDSARLSVTSLYASNVFPYFRTKEEKSSFIASIESVSSEGTELIAAAQRLKQYTAEDNKVDGFVANFFYNPAAFI